MDSLNLNPDSLIQGVVKLIDPGRRRFSRFANIGFPDPTGRLEIPRVHTVRS